MALHNYINLLMPFHHQLNLPPILLSYKYLLILLLHFFLFYIYQQFPFTSFDAFTIKPMNLLNSKCTHLCTIGLFCSIDIENPLSFSYLFLLRRWISNPLLHSLSQTENASYPLLSLHQDFALYQL